MTKAEDDVLAERAKQRVRFSNDHDDDYIDGEMAQVAGGLLLQQYSAAPDWIQHILDKHHRDDRKLLVIAAALIIAEIDRLDREKKVCRTPLALEDPHRCMLLEGHEGPHRSFGGLFGLDISWPT